MGMDVYGKAPISETGKYFRANIWSWRPLAEYVELVAPVIASFCEYWDSNDGDGLDAAHSIRLAKLLEAELASGRTAEYERIYISEQEMLPNVTCKICAGTGTRPPAPAIGAGDPKNGGMRCKGCDGLGFVRPNGTYYSFEAETVARFAKFLKDCGGFEIW